MKEYSFLCDYSEGAHPKILKALFETNELQQKGYSEDTYTREAIFSLQTITKSYNADIHFVTGGTQANLIVISSILKPYQSVISAQTGHINVHEAGAIEFTGHKINIAKTNDGKLKPEHILAILEEHTDEHMVKPGMVYLSNSTETGCIYKRRELEDISSLCKKNNLYLYLDGARLGTALCSRENDLSIDEISHLVDVFYIGGTKNGALFGEAIIINNNDLKPFFRFHLKQKGALLAKGRFLGLQFLELFRDNLYFSLAQHANNMAYKLQEAIEQEGFSFLAPVFTNQIFPILPNELIQFLKEKFLFYEWSKVSDNLTAIRLVTSWATTFEAVELFINELRKNKIHFE